VPVDGYDPVKAERVGHLHDVRDAVTHRSGPRATARIPGQGRSAGGARAERRLGAGRSPSSRHGCWTDPARSASETSASNGPAPSHKVTVASHAAAPQQTRRRHRSPRAGQTLGISSPGVTT